MSSDSQVAYQPLPKHLEHGSPTAPPPLYDQHQQQSSMQPTPFITVAPNVHMAASVSAPPMNFNVPVGPSSVEMTCPSCRSRIRTRIKHRATAKTHIACLLLSWTCCCCCLPYCMDSCRNANHFCPMCGSFLGTYQS